MLFNTVIRGLGITIELFHYYLWFFLLFGLKKKNIVPFSLVGVGLGIVTEILLYRQFGDIFTLVFLYTIVFIFFVEKGKRSKFFGVYFVIVLGVELLYALLQYGLDLTIFGVKEIGTRTNLEILCCDIIFIALELVISIMIKKREMFFFLNKTLIMNIVVGIIGCIVIFASFTVVKSGNVISNGKMLFVLVCIVSTGVLYIITSVRQGYILNKNAELREREYKYQCLLESQKKYFENLIRHDKNIRSFRHDMKMHVITLKTLIEEGSIEKVKSYIDKIYQEDINFEGSETFTGYNVLDAVINDCKSRALQYNIQFKFSGMLKLYDSEKEYDLAIIFFNSLNNAIEYCMSLEGSVISIEITTDPDGEEIILCIKNTCLLKDRDNIETLSTSKENKEEHGIGMNNIRCAAEHSGGKVRFRIYNGYFMVIVQI